MFIKYYCGCIKGQYFLLYCEKLISLLKSNIMNDQEIIKEHISQQQIIKYVI